MLNIAPCLLLEGLAGFEGGGVGGTDSDTESLAASKRMMSHGEEEAIQRGRKTGASLHSLQGGGEGKPFACVAVICEG